MSQGMDAIMAAISGGGAPAGPPVTAPGGPSEAPEPSGDTSDYARQIVELVQQALRVEEDDLEKQKYVKLLQIAQDILATEQKEAQDAMQGKVSPRLLSKAYGG